MMMSRDAFRILPIVPYEDFSEVLKHLDMSGATFEAHISRQISTLYFLLRLRVVVSAYTQGGTDKRLAMLNDVELPDVPFPEGLIETSPQHSLLQLLANYLTESWNWYIASGPTRNQHEAIARSRVHYLVLQVVNAYGHWVWPFFYHYESSDHVDHMLKLVEDSNGRIPLGTRKN